MPGIRPKHIEDAQNWFQAMKLYYACDEDVMLLCSMLEEARDELSCLRGEQSGIPKETSSTGNRAEDEWSTGG